MPEDLGQPDAAGVYTKHTATGTLYFRQAQPHLGVAPHWEWSTDRALWIPTSYVSSEQLRAAAGVQPWLALVCWVLGYGS